MDWRLAGSVRNTGFPIQNAYVTEKLKRDLRSVLVLECTVFLGRFVAVRSKLFFNQ